MLFIINSQFYQVYDIPLSTPNIFPNLFYSFKNMEKRGENVKKSVNEVSLF